MEYENLQKEIMSKENNFKEWNMKRTERSFCQKKEIKIV